MSGKRRLRKPDHTDKFALAHIACNGDGGAFEGRAHALQIARRGEHIDFDSGMSGPKFTELDGNRFRLLRTIFAFDESKEYVGNWCWNAYRVTVPAAALLMRLALRNRMFAIDGASGDVACSLSELLETGAASQSLVETMLADFGRENLGKSAK